MFHEYAEQKLFNPKPAPTVSLACSECRCGMVGRKFADCLSRRFRKAYDRINSDSIATWYFDLSGQDEIDVRAFFRFATLSNLTIRMAFERILTQELSPDLSQREGVELKEVILQGKGRAPVGIVARCVHVHRYGRSE